MTFARLALNIEQSLFKGSWISQPYAKCFSNKLQLPAPPKRPLTAFLLFCKDIRQDLFKNQSLSAPQQTKILAEKWGNLNSASRKTYEDIARADTIEYGQVHKKYYENLTDEQRNELSQQKSLKRESKKLYRLKKALKESGLPKGPTSSYALYLQAQAKEKTFTTIAEFSKQIGLKWRTLSEEERKLYTDLAQDSRGAYEKQMKEWREKLIKKGDTNLLKEFDALKLKSKGSKKVSEDPKTLKKKAATKSISAKN